MTTLPFINQKLANKVNDYPQVRKGYEGGWVAVRTLTGDFTPYPDAWWHSRVCVWVACNEQHQPLVWGSAPSMAAALICGKYALLDRAEQQLGLWECAA